MVLPELDGLIVEHLADIDRAAARIDGIQTVVFTAMGERAEEWARRQGWVSDFSYPKGGWDDWEAWVAPPEWRTADTAADGDEFDAWFTLGVGAGDTEEGNEGEDWFYLTRLCRMGVGEIGLRFKPDGIARPRQWKKAFPRLAELVSGTGFVADREPSLFLPFAIDPGDLATALRDEDPDAALGSFEAALDALLKAKPAFDRVVQQLRAPEA